MSLGFVGLGAMGAPIAANLAAAGHPLVVYDSAGTAARAPAGARVAESTAAVARAAETVFVCVPDGAASLAVADAVVAVPQRRTGVFVDFSTVGIEAAQALHDRLRTAGIVYVDCPVSGGRAGAVAGTITAIWAGPEELLERHRAIIEAMAGNIFYVGARPGQGQAMKLLNNYLSATAMAATSEAVVFGLAQGLELDTMLAVLNVSTGRNTATSDKFPRRIASGTFDAGFRSALMAKDLSLYRRAVDACGTPHDVAAAVDALWQDVVARLPQSDITEIFKLLRAAR